MNMMPRETLAYVHHDLKTHAEHFGSLWDRNRFHEIRRDDRAEAYAVGHVVRLLEFLPDSQRYTGRWVRVIITHVTPSGPVAPMVSIPSPLVVFSFREIGRGMEPGATRPRRAEGQA